VRASSFSILYPPSSILHPPVSVSAPARTHGAYAPGSKQKGGRRQDIPTRHCAEKQLKPRDFDTRRFACARDFSQPVRHVPRRKRRRDTAGHARDLDHIGFHHMERRNSVITFLETAPVGAGAPVPRQTTRLTKSPPAAPRVAPKRRLRAKPRFRLRSPSSRRNFRSSAGEQPALLTEKSRGGCARTGAFRTRSRAAGTIRAGRREGPWEPLEHAPGPRESHAGFQIAPRAPQAEGPGASAGRIATRSRVRTA